MRDFRDYLDDMVDYAEKAHGFVGRMSWEEFADDERTRFATIRAIEVVGEAARRVPPEIRDRFPAIPWARIIGMRNVLAHDYMGTNPRVIYDTAVIFLPKLLLDMKDVIALLDGDG